MQPERGSPARWAPLPDRLQALAGWRRALAAVGLGALAILAMAPFFWSPVLLVSMPGLVWLIDGCIRRAGPAAAVSDGSRSPWLAGPRAQAFGVGWCFGFGYHLAGLFWIGEAFLVEAERFAALMPFAVTLMPAGLALFWGAAAAAAACHWQPGLARALALAVSLSAAEWLRGHVLSGFPWNILGYALTHPLPLMQTASLVGIYGLSLITVLMAAMPGLIVHEARCESARQRAWLGLWALLIPTLAMLAAGTALLALRRPAAAEPIRMRIVQPSVPQREKWRPENQERIFREHIELSLGSPAGAADGAAGIGLIVWPEAAMPFLPLHSPAALAAIGRMLPEGAHLVSGALRLEEAPAGGRPAYRQVFNSLLVLGPGGRLVASYDKIHLVPFGEYLPLQSTLEAIGLEQLTRLRGGFAAGVSPRPLLAIPGLPRLGPLICYEAIFPGAIVQGSARPAALINVTNDGWFGNTTGPRQHLHQARVRAVEEGLPLIRSANNGISAVVDAQGRTLASLGMNEKGVIDAALPAAMPPPLYARFGDAIFAAMMAAGAATLALLHRRRRHSLGASGSRPGRS